METPDATGVLLTPRRAADFLSLSLRWLELKRYQGDGPPFVRISCRCVRYRRSAIDFRGQAVFMVLGQGSVVSYGAPHRYWGCCAPVVVGCYLSANYLGNGAPNRSRKRRLWRFIHISLAGNAFILSSTGVGVYGLLHSIWIVGCGQLVLGTSASIYCAWKS